MPRQVKIGDREVTISDGLLDKLSTCRTKGAPRPCPMTEEQQAALVEGWPRLNHTDLSEALGISKNTALSWYRKLTKKRDEIT